MWTTAASHGSRLVTLVSTFILTRFLAPDVQGEVNLAVVFVTSIGAIAMLGVGQFITAHPKEGREAAFHGTVLLLGGGVVAAAASLAAADPVAAWLNAPGMAAYVPGLVVSNLIDRMGWIQRSILLRDLRFRSFALRLALGELSYAATSVLFASLEWGGHAIVAGNIARACVSLLFLLAVTDFREYLLPHRLKQALFARMLRFGMPITIASFFQVAATNWDNLFMGWRFGSGTVGVYNQAYRLADLPVAALGDQINDILIPTFARVEDTETRSRGFLRAAGLLGLLVFPLAAGLSVVAPTLVEVFYPPNYAHVAPFLVVLASLSMFRALGNLASAMLQVVNRTRILVLIDGLLVVMVLGLMALLAPLGSVAASAGVGIAFTVSVALTVRALRPDGISVAATAAAVARPLLACIPMVLAVLGVRALIGGLFGPLRLALEIITGMATFIAAAFLFAAPTARDFLALGRSTLERRRARSGPSDQETKGDPKAEPSG